MARLSQIKASAGSGKTYTLTRLFLQRLAAASWKVSGSFSACALQTSVQDGDTGWGEIMAITFTNAAAREMRERVIETLKRIALGEPDPHVPLTAEEARRRVDAILHDLGRLNIRTIDSLLHLIVRSAALELQLPPDFEPVFASREAVSPYLDLLLQQAWNEDPAFEERRQRLFTIFSMLVNHKNKKGFMAGTTLAANLFEQLDGALLGKFDNVCSPQEAIEIAERCQARINTCAAILQQGMTSDIFLANAVKAIQNPEKSSKYLEKDSLLELCSAAARKKGLMPDASLLRAYDDLRAALAEKPIAKAAVVRAPFIELARILAAAYMQNIQEEGRMPAVLVPTRAASVLGSPDGVPACLCRLGTRLSHFFVDEFQDTSREQWHALKPLIIEALSRGGSLTWVGDVKQAIYSWRGGDARLFDEVLEDPELRALEPQPECSNLPFNWRSRRVIVEYNNAVFAPLAQRETARKTLAALVGRDFPEAMLEEAAARVAQAFTGAAQRVPDGRKFEGGFVQVRCLDAPNKAELDTLVLEKTVALLQELGTRRPWSDMLLLVRANHEAASLTRTLARAGIPFVTENSLLLSDNSLVRQSVALLSFLATPSDDVAFWTVISGSIVQQLPSISLDWQQLHDWRLSCSHEDGSLWKQFAGAWPDIWERLFAPFLSQAGLMSPYDLVREWYALCQVEQRYPGDSAFLRRFLEVVHAAEGLGHACLPLFLQHWHDAGAQEKIPMPEGLDAVRIMTIHKSKGLEAPVVLVPWLTNAVRVSNDVQVSLAGREVSVANIKALGEPYYAELLQQACESLNQIYVAFTRAREELYIFRTTAESLKRANICKGMDVLWQTAGMTPPFTSGTVPATAGEEAEQEPSAQVQEPAVPAPLPAAGEWRPMQWLPRLKVFRNPLEELRFRPKDKGILFHSCLEHLEFSGDRAQDAARAVARVRLSSTPSARAALDAGLGRELEEMVYWCLTQSNLQDWLQRGVPEQPLLTAGGQVLRADLLVRESWGLLIVDYKTGDDREEYVQQMRGYIKCLPERERASACALLLYADRRCFRAVGPEVCSGLESDYRQALRAVLQFEGQGEQA